MATLNPNTPSYGPIRSFERAESVLKAISRGNAGKIVTKNGAELHYVVKITKGERLVSISALFEQLVGAPLAQYERALKEGYVPKRKGELSPLINRCSHIHQLLSRKETKFNRLPGFVQAIYQYFWGTKTKLKDEKGVYTGLAIRIDNLSKAFALRLATQPQKHTPSFRPQPLKTQTSPSTPVQTQFTVITSSTATSKPQTQSQATPGLITINTGHATSSPSDIVTIVVIDPKTESSPSTTSQAQPTAKKANVLAQQTIPQTVTSTSSDQPKIMIHAQPLSPTSSTQTAATTIQQAATAVTASATPQTQAQQQPVAQAASAIATPNTTGTTSAASAATTQTTATTSTPTAKSAEDLLFEREFGEFLAANTEADIQKALNKSKFLQGILKLLYLNNLTYKSMDEWVGEHRYNKIIELAKKTRRENPSLTEDALYEITAQKTCKYLGDNFDEEVTKYKIRHNILSRKLTKNDYLSIISDLAKTRMGYDTPIVSALTKIVHAQEMVGANGKFFTPTTQPRKVVVVDQIGFDSKREVQQPIEKQAYDAVSNYILQNGGTWPGGTLFIPFNDPIHTMLMAVEMSNDGTCYISVVDSMGPSNHYGKGDAVQGATRALQDRIPALIGKIDNEVRNQHSQINNNSCGIYVQTNLRVLKDQVINGTPVYQILKNQNSAKQCLPVQSDTELQKNLKRDRELVQPILARLYRTAQDKGGANSLHFTNLKAAVAEYSEALHNPQDVGELTQGLHNALSTPATAA